MALDLKVADNCWVCEGWVQQSFVFIPGVSNDLPDGVKHDPHVPIFLHLEQDNFERDLLLPDDLENPTKYVSTRMIAPGKGQKYFFST